MFYLDFFLNFTWQMYLISAFRYLLFYYYLSDFFKSNHETQHFLRFFYRFLSAKFPNLKKMQIEFWPLISYLTLLFNYCRNKQFFFLISRKAIRFEVTRSPQLHLWNIHNSFYLFYYLTVQPISIYFCILYLLILLSDK